MSFSQLKNSAIPLRSTSLSEGVNTIKQDMLRHLKKQHDLFSVNCLSTANPEITLGYLNPSLFSSHSFVKVRLHTKTKIPRLNESTFKV